MHSDPNGNTVEEWWDEWENNETEEDEEQDWWSAAMNAGAFSPSEEVYDSLLDLAVQATEGDRDAREFLKGISSGEVKVEIEPSPDVEDIDLERKVFDDGTFVCRIYNQDGELIGIAGYEEVDGSLRYFCIYEKRYKSVRRGEGQDT